LHGFVEQVFDDRTGSLHDRPSVNAIRAVRQLTLVFKKIERETTEARKRNAELSYLNCEVDLERVDESLSAIDRHEFNIAFAELYSPVLNRLNEAIERGEVKPKHGPGSTQDKLLGNRKWLFPKWTERLENVFPYAQYCSHTWMPLSDYRTTTLPMEQEPPVKVVFVPKTQKTPRVIAMEPTHMQYMQQAIMTTLVPLLENSWIGRSQGFSDQLPNRDLAREGSRSRRYATIDLSEASDRVLNSLVLSATRAWPTVQEALQATRSTHSQLPSGKVIKLRKFASMGSALCFPLEVMVFTTLVYMGIARTGAYSRDERYELFMSGEVRVYGDDIIVPADSTSCVEMTLESFGLKVNRSKSFSEGYFRESCGGDYYSGTDVTPVRLRVDLPSRKQHAQQIVSVRALADEPLRSSQLACLGRQSQARAIQRVEKVAALSNANVKRVTATWRLQGPFKTLSPAWGKRVGGVSERPGRKREGAILLRLSRLATVEGILVRGRTISFAGSRRNAGLGRSVLRLVGFPPCERAHRRQRMSGGRRGGERRRRAPQSARTWHERPNKPIAAQGRVLHSVLRPVRVNRH
jgi:hypothetical protein